MSKHKLEQWYLSKLTPDQLRTMIKPVILTHGFTPMAIMLPYTHQTEMQVWDFMKEVKFENVTYEEYQKKMMERAMEGLHYGDVTVSPGHVIAMENLEETKKVNKMAAGFLLEAWKRYAAHETMHICENCGFEMTPKQLVNEHPRQLTSTNSEPETTDEEDSLIRVERVRRKPISTRRTD